MGADLNSSASKASPDRLKISDGMEMFGAMTTTPPAKPPRPIATPCVKVCAVDGASGYCLGCRRTLAEIAFRTGTPPGVKPRSAPR